MIDWIKRRKLILVAGCAVAAVVLVVVVRGSRHEVMVSEAFAGPLNLRIAASGLVETDSTDLAFQGGGRIVDLAVKEGDAVAQSDILARIEVLSAVPGTLDLADVVQAPYDGTVVDVYLKQGAVVAPGQPLMRLAASWPRWVTAFLDGEDAAHVRPGQRFHCRAGGYLSEPRELVVRAVGTEAVPRRDLPGSSRQVRVRCDPVGPGFPLPPGTEVDIDGDIPLVEDALLIPAAAVAHEGSDDWVWLVVGDRVERCGVQVGPNNFDLIQIRAGLKPGDTVVVHGKEGLRDGQRVKTSPMPPMADSTTGGA